MRTQQSEALPETESPIPAIAQEPLDAFEAALLALVLSAHRNRRNRAREREQEAWHEPQAANVA